MLVAIDYVVILAFLAATLAVGFWSSRQAKRSSRTFFVAEKALPWWVVGFAMVAACASAEHMIGQVGYAKSAGLAVSNWDFAAFPSYVLMIFIFLPLYLRRGITTIPEYLEGRYGATTRLLFAVYTVFNNACVTLVMVLALGATALKYFVGLELRTAVIILTVVTGLYTIYGGMLSVAWTQTLQAVLLLGGGMLLFAAGMVQVPDGWSGLFERMDQATPPLTHLIRPIEDPYVPWPGLILLALSTNVWYCCTNQFYIQSCLGAKDERHGRLGVLLAAVLAPVLTLCFAFPGYIANDLIGQGLLPPLPLGEDGQPDANATYPHLVEHLLGPGLRGFIVIAALGAIMSSVAAVTNATASVFTNDLYKRWIRPGSSDRHLVTVGRLVGIVTLVGAYPLTLFAAEYRFIFTYSQNAWCILAIPIMLVFTYGILWKRATNQAATATFLVLVPFVAVPFVYGNEENNFLDLPFVAKSVHLFNFAFVLWIAAAAFMFVVSLLTRPSAPGTVAPYVWTPDTLRPPDCSRAAPRWFQRVGFWCLVAATVYVGLYIIYW